MVHYCLYIRWTHILLSSGPITHLSFHASISPSLSAPFSPLRIYHLSNRAFLDLSFYVFSSLFSFPSFYVTFLSCFLLFISFSSCSPSQLSSTSLHSYNLHIHSFLSSVFLFVLSLFPCLLPTSYQPSFRSSPSLSIISLHL